ncbi:MAG: hypothetical protein ACRETX_13610, partial [Steroidobacteraceae bacterium]
MTNTSESLQQKIESVVEQLVREHFAGLEAIASAAVREGFRRAMRISKPQHAGASAGRRRSPSRRRPRAEVADLEERLFR